MADRADVLTATVKAGVDRAEDLARERRVLGDDACDFRDVRFGLLRQIEDLDGDGRQRWQAGTLPDATNQLLVHARNSLSHANIDTATAPDAWWRGGQPYSGIGGARVRLC